VCSCVRNPGGSQDIKQRRHFASPRVRFSRVAETIASQTVGLSSSAASPRRRAAVLTNRCTEQVPCPGFVGSTGVMRCPNPVYSSPPRSRLVKRRPVPTAGEQCGCTMLRELARRVANASHSVVPSARNSVLRSSNMKMLPRRAKAPG
jgi:hypothetical protein